MAEELAWRFGWNTDSPLGEEVSEGRTSGTSADGSGVMEGGGETRCGATTRVGGGRRVTVSESLSISLCRLIRPRELSALSQSPYCPS